MLTTIDHISLVARDLKTAAPRQATLFGREPQWRSADGGAECVWFQLDNTSVTVIAPVGPGERGDRAQAQLELGGEGIWAIAFATPDLAKERHVFARRGLASTDAQALPADDARPPGERDLMMSALDAEATHGVTLQLVEQQSPLDPTGSNAAAVSGLDHVVITTSYPERAAALYGARLGLEMKLDRTNPDWGSRLMFFKCGDAIVEVAHSLQSADPSAPDRLWGLSWRVQDIASANARLSQAGFNVSGIRTGRKPGTKVFTVRDAPAGVPTLVIGRT